MKEKQQSSVKPGPTAPNPEQEKQAEKCDQQGPVVEYFHHDLEHNEGKVAQCLIQTVGQVACEGIKIFTDKTGESVTFNGVVINQEKIVKALQFLFETPTSQDKCDPPEPEEGKADANFPSTNQPEKDIDSPEEPPLDTTLPPVAK